MGHLSVAGLEYDSLVQLEALGASAEKGVMQRLIMPTCTFSADASSR